MRKLGRLLLLPVSLIAGFCLSSGCREPSLWLIDSVDHVKPIAADFTLTLGRDTRISLVVSEREDQAGTIYCSRPGGSAVLRTASVARFFATPCLLGSHSNQLLVLTYYTGGGTGAAEYHWALVYYFDKSPMLQDMGLWAVSSVSQESYEFRLLPDLVSQGDDVAPEFIFFYTARAGNKAAALTGRLQLHRANDCLWRLRPASAEDALSCLLLLDSPLKAVSEWAQGVLSGLVVPPEKPVRR